MSSTIISIDGQEYPFTLQNPFSPEDEQRLKWYFERYLNFPSPTRSRPRPPATHY